MKDSTTMSMSQCQVIGKPAVKTWADYRQGCLDTFGGGHRSDGHLEAFQHGMETVFNLLEAEFPPAEQCKAAPELLEACRRAEDAFDLYAMSHRQKGTPEHERKAKENERLAQICAAAIAKATNP